MLSLPTKLPFKWRVTVDIVAGRKESVLFTSPGTVPFLALCYVYVCVLSLKIDLASRTRYVKLLSVQPRLLLRSLCMSESKTCCFRDFIFTYCTQCIEIAVHIVLPILRRHIFLQNYCLYTYNCLVIIIHY